MSFSKKACALSLYLFVAMSPATFASCGTASCPLELGHDIEAGKWQLGLSFESIVQDAVYVNSTPSDIGAISGHHDEVETVNNKWNLSLNHALSDQWTFGAELPLVHRKHFHIHNHHGETLNEVWNYTAIGDMSIGTEYSWIKDGKSEWKIKTTAALKLPTGATDMVNGDGDEAEVSIQPGSGSYDTTWGIQIEKSLFTYAVSPATYASIPLKIGYQYICTGYGTDSWKNGNKGIITLGTGYMLSPNTTVGVDFHALFIAKAEAGTTGENINNTGGKWLFFSPSLQTTFWDQTTFHITAQMPLYRNVNGIQITSDLNLRMGVSTTF